MLSFTDVLLGAIPGIGWLLWIRRKDDHEPEPWRIVVAVFALGALAALLLAWARPRIEFLLIRDGSSTRDVLLDAFVVTALAEEMVKFLAFAAGALWRAEWDEPLDGIVYGAAAALGFASVENAYFLAATGEAAVVVWRGFTATIAHVVFSASLGFFVGLVRLGRLRPFRGCLLGALCAVVAHGVYDLLLAVRSGPGAALLGALPLLLVALGVQIRWARTRSPAFHPA